MLAKKPSKEPKAFRRDPLSVIIDLQGEVSCGLLVERRTLEQAQGEGAPAQKRLSGECQWDTPECCGFHTVATFAEYSSLDNGQLGTPDKRG